jgi:SGNH domain (fused to AT3 domains)
MTTRVTARKISSLIACAGLLALGSLAVTPAYAGTALSKKSIVSVSMVLQSVRAAQSIESVPAGLQPGLSNTSDVAQAFGNGAPKRYKCHSIPRNKAGIPNYAFGGCVYGDLTGKQLMVVYGDSHAGMWASTLSTISSELGWKLELFDLPGCPLPDLSFVSDQTGDPNTQCSEFHKEAPPAIKALHPNIVVLSSYSSEEVSRGVYATSSQWQSGLESTFKALSEEGTKLIMIGNMPAWENDNAQCLAAHMSNVQSCAEATAEAEAPNIQAEQSASAQTGVQYIPTTSWFCAAKCEPIIGTYLVYLNEYHMTAAYAQYLSGTLEEAMGLAGTSESPSG